MNQNLRNPSCLILSHTQFVLIIDFVYPQLSCADAAGRAAKPLAHGGGHWKVHAPGDGGGANCAIPAWQLVSARMLRKPGQERMGGIECLKVSIVVPALVFAVDFSYNELVPFETFEVGE